MSALLELVGEGVLQPTAQQVAARAGVGLRSVFRHFEDMDDLFATMDATITADALPLMADARPTGDLHARARTLVVRRAALFERIAPYKRAGGLQRWQSPFLRSRHRSLTRALRADLLRWLPELERATPELVEALDLATSFEAWDRLRIDQRLSRARAQSTLERLVLGMLSGEKR